MRTDFLDAWLVFATREASAEVRQNVRDFLGERLGPDSDGSVLIGEDRDLPAVLEGDNPFIEKNINKGGG